MDCKAQVSFEYLLTLAFGVILVVAAFLIALQASDVTNSMELKLLDYRESVIGSLLS